VRDRELEREEPEAMGNHEHGSALHQLVESVLYQAFAFSVESRGG
jgi:hypothetical protein